MKTSRTTSLIAALAFHLGQAAADCPRDNLLRCLVGSPSLAIPFCSSSVGIVPTPVTSFTTTTPTVFITSTRVVTSTKTNRATVTRTINAKRAATSSLACIADLNPNAAAVRSACSCFSNQLTVTSTVTAPTVTKATTKTLVVSKTVTVTSTATTTPPQPTCGNPGFPVTEPPNCVIQGAECFDATDTGASCLCQRTAEGTTVCGEGYYDRERACARSADCARGYTCVPSACLENNQKVCIRSAVCNGRRAPGTRDLAGRTARGPLRLEMDEKRGLAKVVAG